MKHRICALLLGAALFPAEAVAQHSHHGAAPHSAAPHEVTAGALAVSGAFARATLPRAPVAGAYLTLTNHGTQADRLVSVTAPVGKDVQIHDMTHKDGVMVMRHLPEGLEIPAGGSVTLRPGGLHLMIMGLTDKLVEGQRLEMTLHFEKAGPATVPFDILALNARGPAGHTAGKDAGHAHAHGQAAFDQSALDGDQARIIGLLKHMFETDGAPLIVAPVLIDGDVAVIGWMQQETGGRALLRRDGAGLWRVSLCTGDGLKGEAGMIALGVAPAVAARLARAQAGAEAQLPPDQVAAFARFDGVLHIDDNGQGH